MSTMVRRLGHVLSLAVLVCALATPARAVPPGIVIEFDGKDEGKVVFEGAKHTGKDMRCPACHLEIFDVSRSSVISKADHRRKVYCFTCHDGKRAFAARGKCDRCHLEPAEPADTAADASATPATQ